MLGTRLAKFKSLASHSHGPSCSRRRAVPQLRRHPLRPALPHHGCLSLLALRQIYCPQRTLVFLTCLRLLQLLLTGGFFFFSGSRRSRSWRLRRATSPGWWSSPSSWRLSWLSASAFLGSLSSGFRWPRCVSCFRRVFVPNHLKKGRADAAIASVQAFSAGPAGAEGSSRRRGGHCSLLHECVPRGRAPIARSLLHRLAVLQVFRLGRQRLAVQYLLLAASDLNAPVLLDIASRPLPFRGRLAVYRLPAGLVRRPPPAGGAVYQLAPVDRASLLLHRHRHLQVRYAEVTSGSAPC